VPCLMREVWFAGMWMEHGSSRRRQGGKIGKEASKDPHIAGFDKHCTLLMGGGDRLW
jgi:hypothetical protein